MQRRAFQALALGALATLASLTTPATAQTSGGVSSAPIAGGKPIRILVGYAPGGAVDVVARSVAQHLQGALGQSVVVENKPGAGANIAMRALIDSPPDGSTLMLAANALAANVTLYQPPPYELPRDITPISLIGRVPVVLAVAASSPHQTLAQWLQAAKAKPGAMNYGSPGNGSTPHLAIELFERAAGAQLTHVPYKGGSQALNDVLGGHVQAVAVNALEVQPHVKSGKLRVLAVLTPKRSGIFPEVPTVAEAGFPGFEASVWYGLIGPRGLPAALVQQLHGLVQAAIAADELKQRLSGAGGEVQAGSTELFAQLVGSERSRYEKLIRDAKIQPD